MKALQKKLIFFLEINFSFDSRTSFNNYTWVETKNILVG